MRITVSRIAGVEARGSAEEAGQRIIAVAYSTKHDCVRNPPFKVRERLETQDLSVDPRAREGFDGAGSGRPRGDPASIEASKKNLRSKLPK
jgi:hypothetical protein